MNPTLGISFHCNGTAYRLKGRNSIKKVIRKILEEEGKTSDFINVVLCSDEQLLKINREFLDHDYLTDVITFNYAGDPVNDPIEGEIYISADRVVENSQMYKVTPENEMQRVIIHGVLHLCGYNDTSKKQRSLMTQLENKFLELI